ncbi:hypothetical protein HYX04_04435 [Candidatus Woesearchaeota archaeon]|nr:hypothetical protein [Candidatus Woesearchaeota archaeon]
MSAINEMYGILEQMVKSAADGHKQKVLKLNESYESLVPKVYHSPFTKLDLEYDRCRTSCVMSVITLEGHERLVADAQEIFSRIPNPKR